MKKILSMAVALLMMLGMFGISAFAEPQPVRTATVYVTISTADGNFAMAQEKITVTDQNGDGVLTIDEALYAAHEAKYEGGAKSGFESAQTQYGLSLVKLWGDTSGVFGYYVNNLSAMSLSDSVKNGDYINAYVYQDQIAWSDSYAWFDQNTLAIEPGESVSLTLFAAGYDASWNVVTSPVANATIRINGIASSYKTDANGKVTVPLEYAGTFVISATSDHQTLVPPVCKVAVGGEEDPVQNEECGSVLDDNDNEPAGGFLVIFFICLGAILLIVGFIAILVWLKRTKNNR